MLNHLHALTLAAAGVLVGAFLLQSPPQNEADLSLKFPSNSSQGLVLRQLSPQEEALASHLSKKYNKPWEFTRDVVKAAFREGARHEISPLLILAVIEKESSFRHEVVNSYGAVGLMQVVPRWHPDKLTPGEGPTAQLLKPEVNVKVGTKVLAEYLAEKKGDLPAALKKYSGNARKYGPKVEQYRESLQAVLVRQNLKNQENS